MRRWTPLRCFCQLLMVGLRGKCGFGVVSIDCYQQVVVMVGKAERSWPSGLNRWALRQSGWLPFTTSCWSVERPSWLQRCSKGTTARASSNIIPDMKTLQSENQLTSLALSRPFEVGGWGKGVAKILNRIFLLCKYFLGTKYSLSVM